MRIEFDTHAEVGKKLSIAREKSAGAEVLVAQIAIGGLFLRREQVDTLLKQPHDWFNTCFFDDGGAPVFHATLSLPALVVAFSGKFVSHEGEVVLTLTAATLQDVQLTLTKLGAELAGKLHWKARGDEANDSELLLGRKMNVVASIFDAAGATPDFVSAMREMAGVESVTVTGPSGEKVTLYERDADPLYDSAVLSVRSLALKEGPYHRSLNAHVSREFNIGYNRAAALIERMEREGVVSALDDGVREILPAKSKPEPAAEAPAA